MSTKSFLIGQYSKRCKAKIDHDRINAVQDQNRIRQKLLLQAADTQFGKDHNFSKIKDYDDFKKNIPIRDYEALAGYIEKIKQGESNILWPGKPKYFAKTSGTTSGVKYIPITKSSLPNHMMTARYGLMNYIALKGDASVFDGKLIFLSGSPVLSEVGGVRTGRLSGIINHEIPIWAKGNQMPSYQTNCIDEWEKKLDRIVAETLKEDMRLISGIPPWVKMYFDKLLESTGKSTVLELFPNFSLFAHGGVNFKPYASSLFELIGKEIDSFETYPASEGFIAIQDTLSVDAGLLLNTNSGVFFEFVKAEQVFDKKPTRLGLRDVVVGINYAVVINNNAGLWGYSIGDTIQFVSKDPYRIIVSGRVKHFISAFGEHVIAKEVEQAIEEASQAFGLDISEFTVAPQINPAQGLPYHEWFIAFNHPFGEINKLAIFLDQSLCRQNIYYEDLIEGRILSTLKITPLPSDAFQNYMKQIGKLGGQNKVPRLSNNRAIAETLEKNNKL